MKIVQEPGNLSLLGATTSVSTWQIVFHLIHRLEDPFQNIAFKHYLLSWFLLVKWGNWILEGLSKVSQPVNSISWEWKLLWLQGQFPSTVPRYILGVLLPLYFWLYLAMVPKKKKKKSLTFLNLSLSSVKKNHKSQPIKIGYMASTLFPWSVYILYRATVKSLGMVPLAVMKTWWPWI